MLQQNNTVKVTMISNAMSHHQVDFCDSMASDSGVDFHFVATKPISEERLKMGYSDLNKSRDYIVRKYNPNEESAVNKILDDSDFIIIGSAPVSLIKRMLATDKWIFICSERLFKKGIKEIFEVKKIAANILMYSFSSHSKIRLLCASAYASKDYKKFRFKKTDMLKWGYFPPMNIVDIDALQQKKDLRSIVWVGRMIDWKHPETPILLAEKLKQNGVDFNMTVIGTGNMENAICDMAKNLDLLDVINFTGPLPATEVRKYIDTAEIFITTSDYNEGWGAVVNEGLNGGCAVVASSAMGSVPFLITDSKNGFSFKFDDVDSLYSKVKSLLDDDEFRKNIQVNAYNSIINEWNGKNAAAKLVGLFKEYNKGNLHFSYDEGICSIAEVIR